MTTTKVVALIAVIMPFGFVLLAAGLLLRKIYMLHREDQQRRQLAAAA